MTHSFVQLVSDLVQKTRQQEKYLLGKQHVNHKTKELASEIRSKSEAVLEYVHNMTPQEAPQEALHRRVEVLELTSADSNKFVTELRVKVKRLNGDVFKTTAHVSDTQVTVDLLQKRLLDSEKEVQTLKQTLEANENEFRASIDTIQERLLALMKRLSQK